MLIFCLGRSFKSSERVDRKLRTVRRWKPASEADASNAGVQLARNSWSQTHQDDGTRGEARTCSAPILETNIGFIDLPHALENSKCFAFHRPAPRQPGVTVFSFSFPSSGG